MKKGWQVKKLGEISDVFDGPHATPKTVDSGPIFLGIGALQDGIINLGETRHVTEEDFKQWTRRVRPQPGDVVFSYETRLGQAAIIPEGLECCLGRRMGLVRFKGQAVDPQFFLHQYLSPKFREFLDSKTIRGATVDRLSIKDFPSFPIAIPPLAEQQRIVGLLDEAFERLATAKANAEKNLENARALFESHLQSVFTQRGPGWVETTLSRATDGIFTGPFGSLLHKSDYVANGIPLVNPAHITEMGIEPDLRKTVSKATATRLKSYIMRKGDIVIGRRGEMGRCALVTEVEDGWLCGTGSFFIKPSNRCDTRYLVRFLRSEACKSKLERIAGGAVMPNLSNTDLGNLPFDLPPLDRQKAIVKEIDALHNETQRLASLYEQKLAALEALKKSLLHQAFAGEL